MKEAVTQMAVKGMMAILLLAVGDPATGTLGLRGEPLTRQVFKIENIEGAGTGFLIEESGLVLTNHHVVGTHPEQELMSLGGDLFTGEVLETNRLLDLALVRIHDYPGGEPLTLSGKRAERMEPVMSVSWTEEHPFVIREGIVQQLHVSAGFDGNDAVFNEFMIANTDLDPGMSGSPVIRPETGEVIGINVGIYPWSTLSLSVPVLVVERVIEGWISDYAAET
jgi:S1-C subfamily serine protease